MSKDKKKNKKEIDFKGVSKSGTIIYVRGKLTEREKTALKKKYPNNPDKI